jgi:hypothetical protein
MSQMEFDDSGDAPESGKEIPEEQSAVSGDLKNKASMRKKQRNHEWAGDIVANGYLMLLYR